MLLILSLLVVHCLAGHPAMQYTIPYPSEFLVSDTVRSAFQIIHTNVGDAPAVFRANNEVMTFYFGSIAVNLGEWLWSENDLVTPTFIDGRGGGQWTFYANRDFQLAPGSNLTLFVKNVDTSLQLEGLLQTQTNYQGATTYQYVVSVNMVYPANTPSLELDVSLSGNVQLNISSDSLQSLTFRIKNPNSFAVPSQEHAERFAASLMLAWDDQGPNYLFPQWWCSSAMPYAKCGLDFGPINQTRCRLDSRYVEPTNFFKLIPLNSPTWGETACAPFLLKTGTFGVTEFALQIGNLATYNKFGAKSYGYIKAGEYNLTLSSSGIYMIKDTTFPVLITVVE